MNEPMLLTPGPSNVPPRVREAMARPAIHHRSPDFAPVFEECQSGLQYVFRTENPVAIFAGSGTLAMEAAVAGVLSPGDKVLTLEAGKFGERWGELAKVYGIEAVPIREDWGLPIEPASVEFALAKNPGIKAVYATLCETSSGTLTDLEYLGDVVAKTKAILIVDAISGVAADRMETDAWKIDIAIGASQKAMMLPPGLSFAAVSTKARALIETARCPAYYASMKTALDHLERGRTPFTSPVSLMTGLAESLAMIREEGIENVWRRHERLNGALRAAGRAMGLRELSRFPSNALAAFWLPEGIADKDLSRTMRDQHRLTIARGQKHLEGKIFRMAAMGWADEALVLRAAGALEASLTSLGYQLDRGAGTHAAKEFLNARNVRIETA